jgi:site-specific recombinase XerD
MSARYENENKIDMATNKKLENLPKYVAEWNLNLKASRRSASTRREFVTIVQDYLKRIDAVNTRNIRPDAINENNVLEYFISIQTKEKDGRMVATSDSYQICVWSCLNNFFDFMLDRGYIKKNYVRTIQKPKNRDLDRINNNRIQLTAKDFKKILKTFDTLRATPETARDKAIMVTFMTTGMRETALINIELSDIDLEAKALTVIDKETKTHRYVINDVLEDALLDWIAYRDRYTDPKRNDQHLFLSCQKKALSHTSISNIVKKYTSMALGKAVSPHKIRAGVATILYERTQNLEFVRRAIGHSNVQTTQRYVVTKGDERKQAAEIIDKIF